MGGWFGNGLILGRSRALWAGAVAGVLNGLVVLSVFHMTDVQLAAVNLAAFGLISLLANADDPRTVPTFAASITPPAATNAASTSTATATADSSTATSDGSPQPAQAGSTPAAADPTGGASPSP